MRSSIGGPAAYRSSSRLAGDTRNPEAPDYVITVAEYAEILDRKRRGLGQWEKSHSMKQAV